MAGSAMMDWFDVLWFAWWWFFFSWVLGSVNGWRGRRWTMLESNLGLVSLGVGGWRKKRKEKKKVLGSVSLDIRGWKKKIIIINNKVKAALTQSMGPTKSKFFWVVKVENKAPFGSCKSISGKYLFSGNAIFRKRKCFYVFGCISKKISENIFWCLVVFLKIP